MGAKRPRSGSDQDEDHYEAADVEHDTNDAREGQPSAKRARKGKKKHKAREGTVNWSKKRVRDIERRLQRSENLPAQVQNELERELESLQTRLGDDQEKKQRAMMIKKYHMVRFFERKKAQRLEKQLQAQLTQTTDPNEISALEKDIHIVQVDVQYTKYFPYMERYVSLYTEAAAPKADETARAKIALRSERPPLWSTVEKAMTRGHEALLSLQNRRLGINSRAKPPPERPSKHSFAARAKELQARQSGSKLMSETLPGPKAQSGSEKGQPSKPSGANMTEAESAEGEFGVDGGFFSLHVEGS